MVRKVIWSEKAAFERREILNYWINRNKSKSYSKKLNHQIRKTILLISEFPELGIQTDRPNIRVRVVNIYLIFYEIKDENIWILTIWDGRRNAQKLKIN